MARVNGESGRHVSQEAVKKRRKIVTGAMIPVHPEFQFSAFYFLL